MPKLTQARDPRIPGLLVHNEWVGTFEEFEEAVEFGELRQFLGYDAPAQPQRTVPAQPPPSTSRLPPAPTLMATPAAPGQGARPDGGADEMLAQLLPQGAEITDADVDALLKELEKPLKRTPRRTYTPSSRAAPPPMPTPPSHGTPAPDRARYDPGSRNLVEEAARAIGVEPKPRPPVPRMTLNRRPLQEVLEERRSRQAKTEQQRRNDELFASLGLSDVQINDADADEFLNKGTIPQLQHSGCAPEQEAMAAPTSTGAAPETLSVAEPVAETERANEAGAASEAGAGNEGPVEGASTVSLATSEDKESPKDAADVSGAKVGDKDAIDSEEPREQELGDEPSASKTLEQPLDDKLADSETGLNDKLAVQDPTATKSLDESAQLLAETSPEVPVTDKALDDPLAGKAPMGKALDEPLADNDALDKTAKEPLADEHLKEPLTEEAVEKTPDEPLANKALDDSTEKPLDESPADKSLKQPAAATSLAKSLDESLTDKPREKPLEESLADKVAATDETPSSGALEKTLGESLAENEPLDESLEEPLADKSISSEKALDEPLAKEPLSKSLEEPLDDKALESENILEEPLADKSLSKSLEEPLSNKPRDESLKERLADKPLDEPFDKTFASKPLDKSLKDLLEDKPLESSSKQPLDDKLLEKSLNEPLAGSESAADKAPVDVLASKESLNKKPLEKSMEEPLAADNDALEQPPASKSLEEPHAVDKDTLEQSPMDKSLPQPLDEPLANKSLEQSFATEPLEPRKDESLSKSLEEPLGESFGNDSLLEQPLSDNEALGTGLSAEKDAPLESSKDTAPFTVNEPAQEPRAAQDIPEEPMAAKESPEMLLADKETLAANEATEARASKDELAPQTSGLEEPLAGNEVDAAKDSLLTEPVAAKDVPRDEKDLDKPEGSTMSADDQEALAYQQAVAKALAEMQSAGNEDLGAKAAAGQARELPLPPTDKGSLDDTKPLASNVPLSDKGAFDNAAPLSDKNEFTEPIAATQPVGNINDGKVPSEMGIPSKRLASGSISKELPVPPSSNPPTLGGGADASLPRSLEAPLDEGRTDPIVPAASGAFEAPLEATESGRPQTLLAASTKPLSMPSVTSQVSDLSLDRSIPEVPLTTDENVSAVWKDEPLDAQETTSKSALEEPYGATDDPALANKEPKEPKEPVGSTEPAPLANKESLEQPLGSADEPSLMDRVPLEQPLEATDAIPLDKDSLEQPLAAADGLVSPTKKDSLEQPLASEDATAQVPKDTLDEKHGVQDSQLDRTREAPLDMDEKHNAAAMPKQTLFDGAKDPQDAFSDEARVPLADRPALENPLDDLPVTKEALSNEPAADVPVQTQWPETPKDVPSMGTPSEATMPLADTARASEAWNEAPASGAEQFQATPLMATASATDSTERDAPTNTPGMLESSEASGTVEPAVDASVPAVEPQPAAAQPHVPPMSDATHARAHWDSAADMDKAVLGAAPGADVSEDETPVAAKVIGPPSSHAAEDLLHSLERPRARDVRHMSSGATAEEERVAVHQTLDRFSALEPPLAASEVTETHDEHSDAPRSHARDARPMSAGATAEEERVAVHQMLDRFSALEPPLSSNEVAEGHDEHLGTPSSPAAQDTRHMSAGATAEEERVAVHQTLDRFSALEPPLAASEVDLPRDEHSGELPLPDLNDVSSESQRIAEHQVIDRFSALDPPLRVSSERLGGAERNAARIASERGALHTKTLPHAPRDPTESHDTPKAPATSTLPSASVLPHDESSGDDEPDDGVPDLWVSGVPGTSQAFAQSHVAGHRSGTDWDWDAPTSETSGSLHDVPHPESTSHAPTYGISHSDPASLPGDDTVSEYSEDAAHMTAISERESVAPSDSDATLRKVDAPSSVEATPRVETEPAPTPSLAEERAQTPVAVPVPKGPSDAQPEASEDGLARTPPSASHKTFADDAAPKGLLSTPRGTRSPGRAGTSPSLGASRPPPTPEQAVPRFLLDTKAKEPPSEPVQAPAGTLGESPMQDDWNMLQASKEQGERTLPHEPSELPAQTERALPRVPVESEQSAFAPAAIPADTRLPKSRESLLEKAAKGSPVQEPPAAEPQVPNAPAEPSVSSAAELGMGLASSSSADAAPQASSTVGLGSHVPGTEDAASATAAPLPSTGPHSQDPSAGPEAQVRNVPEPKPRSRSSLLEMAVLRARESMAGMSTSRSGETRDAARHDSAAMAPSKSNEPVRDAAEPSSPAAVSEPRVPESPSAAPAAAATSTRPTGRPSLRERLARLSSSDRTKEHAEAGESAADSATSPRASAGAPRGELPPAPGGPRAFPSAAEGDESEQSFADQSVVDRWADRSFDAAAPTEASKDEARFDNGAANVLDASVLPSDKSSEKVLGIGLDKGGAQSLLDSAPSNTSLDKSFDKPLDKSFGRPLDTPLDQPTLGSTGPTGPTTQDPSPSAPVPAPSAASAPPRRAVSGAPPRRAIPDVRSLSAAQPRRTHRKTLSEVMREADEFLQEWK